MPSLRRAIAVLLVFCIAGDPAAASVWRPTPCAASPVTSTSSTEFSRQALIARFTSSQFWGKIQNATFRSRIIRLTAAGGSAWVTAAAIRGDVNWIRESLWLAALFGLFPVVAMTLMDGSNLSSERSRQEDRVPGSPLTRFRKARLNRATAASLHRGLLHQFQKDPAHNGMMFQTLAAARSQAKKTAKEEQIVQEDILTRMNRTDHEHFQLISHALLGSVADGTLDRARGEDIPPALAAEPFAAPRLPVAEPPQTEAARILPGPGLRNTPVKLPPISYRLGLETSADPLLDLIDSEREAWVESFDGHDAFDKDLPGFVTFELNNEDHWFALVSLHDYMVLSIQNFIASRIKEIPAVDRPDYVRRNFENLQRDVIPVYEQAFSNWNLNPEHRFAGVKSILPLIAILIGAALARHFDWLNLAPHSMAIAPIIFGFRRPAFPPIRRLVSAA